MRLGVIDVGSNTVHLLVVDAHSGGAQPLPTSSHKIALRLSEHVEDDGRIAEAGRDRLASFVDECLHVGEDQGVEELLGFATSAIREAPNGDDVLTFVKDRTGVTLDVLSGPDEAKLTFLAIRRWFGWSAGTLL
ncbi:MAG TPA: Ppx/GppA family phosphatase, partial [Phycicoccus sp.]|nr:Ppx/GppA family phosphatase [Phycicoccus sp.]